MKGKLTVQCPRCTQVFKTRREYEFPESDPKLGSTPELGMSPQEPVFVLRAQDRSAPALVQMWIALNQKAPVEKLQSAQGVLESMRAWAIKKDAD